MYHICNTYVTFHSVVMSQNSHCTSGQIAFIKYCQYTESVNLIGIKYLFDTELKQ